MKSKFYKKIFWGLILIMVLAILSAGCAGTVTPPPPPPPPTTCTLTIYSQDFWCYGYVWVNGISTGQWIDWNGMVSVSGLTVGTTASVQIVDNFGWGSHVEYLILQAGNNIVVFTYWL